MNWETLDRLVWENANVEKHNDQSRKWISDTLKSAARFIIGVPEKVECPTECARDAMVDGNIALPFKTVKIIDTVRDLVGGEHGYLMGVRSHHLTILEAVRGGMPPPLDEYVVVAIVDEEELERAGKADCEGISIKGGILRHGEAVCTVQDSRQVALSCLGLINRMAWFISLVNTPGHYVTRVEPPATKANGRSVEWVQGKSHYIVIDRQHGKELLRQGGRMDFEGTITRAMHDRRAHSRTLQSPYFKHKRGQRIWIRQAWIGPKQWEGKDRKVYKIINPEGKRLYEKIHSSPPAN